MGCRVRRVSVCQNRRQGKVTGILCHVRKGRCRGCGRHSVVVSVASADLWHLGGLPFGHMLALWGFSLIHKVAHELLCEAVCADGGQSYHDRPLRVKDRSFNVNTFMIISSFI